jgi:hypothetical protein
MARKTLSGRIIRILDNTTVIVNLGSSDGITSETVFSVLGEPEDVVDPETTEVLGTVSIVKGRVRAKSVSDKFTICTSTWKAYAFEQLLGMMALGAKGQGTVSEEGGAWRVLDKDVKPWRAVSEDFVRVGDQVETTIDVRDEQSSEVSDDELVPKPKTDD